MPRKILVITNMLPNLRKKWLGTFVKDQILNLRRVHAIDINVINVKGRQADGAGINYLKGYLALTWMLRLNRYELIHSHHFYMNLLYQATFRRIPLVYTMHEGEFFRGNPLRRFFIRYCARKADHVIFVNKSAYEEMALPHATLLPCGIDMRRFSTIPHREKLRDELNLLQDVYYIFFPADPKRPEKNAAFAFDFIKNHSVWLAQSRIEFIFGGSIRHKDMPKWMNAVDLLVSFSKFESDGIVYKEAMACNLPVVTFDVGNAWHYFADAEAGLVIEPTHEELSKAIMHWREKGRSNGRFLLTKLGMDLETVNGQIIEIYNGVLERRCAAHQNKIR